MRAALLLLAALCLIASIRGQVAPTQGSGIPNPNLIASMWRFTGYNSNIYEIRNWECMSRDMDYKLACTGPWPWNYTDETKDQIRTWYCGTDMANITIQMYNTVVWPILSVYIGSGNPVDACFTLAVEGDASLSIYQGAAYFFMTTDFKTSNCFNTQTVTFEMRNVLTLPFNPRTFRTDTCSGTVIFKIYTGLDPQWASFWSRRVAFRNTRGNITVAQNNGLDNYWRDQQPMSYMELGNWAGFEPVFNIYGNFYKFGTFNTRTVLQTTSSTIKMTWHNTSMVNIASPWMINDLRPVSGPNTIQGYVMLNNSNLQIEGNWQITPSAYIEGRQDGYGNLTYLAANSGSTLTLAGTFNNMFFFGNSSGVTYVTTGTFNNVSAILTDRCTSWTWTRQNVTGVATFANIQIASGINLTLRDGIFSFDSKTGAGGFNLVNAQATVAGRPWGT